MTGRAIPTRVWMVFEDDVSHGIQGIFGLYSTEEKAKEAAQAVERDGRNSFDVCVQDWPLDV